MHKKEQERQKTSESSFALKRTVCMSVFPPDPSCSPGPEWGNRVFIAVKTSEVLRKKLPPAAATLPFWVLYAVRVPSVSFLKLSRSQQTSSCSCTIPHSASYQAANPRLRVCAAAATTQSRSQSRRHWLILLLDSWLDPGTVVMGSKSWRAHLAAEQGLTDLAG